VPVRVEGPRRGAEAAGVAVAVAVVLLVAGRSLRVESSELRVALETSQGLIALLVAFLVYGRYRQRLLRNDLVLAYAFGMLAAVGLALTAAPAVVSGLTASAAGLWAPLTARLAAAGALAVAGLLPERQEGVHARAGWLVVSACALTTATVLLGTGIAGDRLPAGVEVADGSVSGDLAVTMAQLVIMVLLGAAAAGFARRARAAGDHFLAAVAVAAALGAAARLVYSFSPSLYTDVVDLGDVLRLVSYVVLLMGAAREIEAYWSARARQAVVEERQRVARELHDGLAQELAFIRSQVRSISQGRGDPRMMGFVVEAADRALAESRQAIAVLSDPADADLALSLGEVARTVAERAGAAVVVAAEGAGEVPLVVRDNLVRIVREATGNAVRHGGAATVRVSLVMDGGTGCLTVEDDGGGCDATVDRPAGFGLTSMRSRARTIGGTLSFESAPGAGARVRVEFPLDGR
jgi:signal transduction histidine kinase